jgi:hypothetical protein
VAFRRQSIVVVRNGIFAKSSKRRFNYQPIPHHALHIGLHPTILGAFGIDLLKLFLEHAHEGDYREK